MENALSETQQVYERLWRRAVPAFERNEFEVDPQLPDKADDLRRGLTLVFRPSSIVQAAISVFLRELAATAPGQYYYRPEEFHVTVLAVIPGSERWREKMDHLTHYQAIIGEVLKRHRKFSIAFRGVTATPGAVMIQGFPTADTLAQIRDDLRETLGRNGFGGQLDVRYKINTAHITAMRFSQANIDGKRLLALLAANRAADFGEVQVADLELIFGDWYASATVARTLRAYQLTAC